MSFIAIVAADIAVHCIASPPPNPPNPIPLIPLNPRHPRSPSLRLGQYPEIHDCFVTTACTLENPEPQAGCEASNIKRHTIG